MPGSRTAPVAAGRRGLGGGVAATTSLSQALSRPVGTRVSQLSRQVSRAGTRRSTCAAGPGGDVDPRCPRDADQISVDLAVQVATSLLVHEVPLVEREDKSTPRLDHHRDDAQVLLGQHLTRVDDDDRDLGSIQRCCGTQARVVLGARGLGHPAPDAGGVDEAPGTATELHQLIDGIARRATDGVDDRALVAQPAG